MEALNKKLSLAVDKNDFSVVKNLLQQGADINSFSEGMPILLNAIRKGNLECVKLLVEHGADIHVCDDFGSAALHYAAMNGSLEISDYFIEKGLDVNAGNMFLWTPLHCAAMEGHAGEIKLLLERGADVHAIDATDSSALHMAANHLDESYPDCVECLLDYKCDVNLRDGDGDTPLYLAVKTEDRDSIRILLNHGADPYLANDNGFNVFSLMDEQPEMAAFIEECVLSRRIESGSDSSSEMRF